MKVRRAGRAAASAVARAGPSRGGRAGCFVSGYWSFCHLRREAPGDPPGTSPDTVRLGVSLEEAGAPPLPATRSEGRQRGVRTKSSQVSPRAAGPLGPGGGPRGHLSAREGHGSPPETGGEAPATLLLSNGGHRSAPGCAGGASAGRQSPAARQHRRPGGPRPPWLRDGDEHALIPPVPSGAAARAYWKAPETKLKTGREGRMSPVYGHPGQMRRQRVPPRPLPRPLPSGH